MSEILREVGGYYTAHSGKHTLFNFTHINTYIHTYMMNAYTYLHEGKWHLGGMREEQRKDRVNDDRSSQPNLT